jgi:hypothetical protein
MSVAFFTSLIKHLMLILCFKNLKHLKGTNHCFSETLTAPAEGNESKLMSVCTLWTNDISSTFDCFTV